MLTFLLEHLAGTRVLLLCTYRSDFASLWSRKSYHSVLTLKLLDPHEGFEMLTALLGTPRMQDELAALVLNKTEGVPFFLEELVTALRETGTMALDENQWRLTAPATAVPVPDTVEEVLMARLDRLPEGAKSVLQTGAVIGREVSEALLREVVGLPEHELTTHLAALTEAELLYTRGLHPQTTYVFKHAFTQEATYRSVLTARRRELHHRVAVTIEALFPDRLRERLRAATEMVQLAEAAGDSELILEAHNQRMLCLLDHGDIQEVDVELEVRARLTEELQQSSYLAVTTGVRAMRALLDGRFTEAERLALQARDIEQQVQSERAAGAFGVQMFTLRREQGRLREVELALRHFVQQHGAASAWRPGLALLYSELGREREARVAFVHLAQHDFADLPRDALWVGCITYLAEVCAFLGDAARAAILYQLLLPYAGHTVVLGGGVVCYGAASRYLGMLATTMARWDAAEQHFTDALAMNARMDARPWLAHTQHAYAKMPLARNQPGDHAKAMALLDTALTTARALGMHALEARLTGQIEPRAALAPAVFDSRDDLSQREVEVLRLLAVGKSSREIANVLCISLHTVPPTSVTSSPRLVLLTVRRRQRTPCATACGRSSQPLHTTHHCGVRDEFARALRQGATSPGDLHAERVCRIVCCPFSP